MKLCLVIPDGVGIRNFLFTEFVDRLLDSGQVVAWHALPESSVASVARRWPGVRWERLPDYREAPGERLLRNAKTYSQIYWRQPRDQARVMLSFRRPTGSLRRQAFEHASRWLGRAMGSRQGTLALHRAHGALVERRPYFPAFAVFLERERPDVVFCTHQRASRAVPAMLAARRLGIPTATFVFSWDNLPKGRMAVHADHFLVWSDHMREELLGFHPEVDAEAVHVVGTPQFEPYFDEDRLLSREAFAASVGLDPARRIVCFSGDDRNTSPADDRYLEDLARAVAQLPEAGRPQLLFRRCPTDWSDRYDRVLQAYPDIAVCDPLWLHGERDWTQVVPTAEDAGLLANVVHHCDLVINFASTMALDFAIVGKPAVYVDYDPPGVPFDGWTSEAIYRLPHFSTVHDLDPVHWARSPGEIASVVSHALAFPDDRREAREEWVSTIATRPLDQASRRCADALARIASGGVQPGASPAARHRASAGPAR